MTQEKTNKQDLIYTGKFSDLQTYGNSFYEKRYNSHNYNSLNDYQNLLYNRALFGLSIYSSEEISNMRWDKKKRIIKVHKRAQSIINLWKQELVNKFTTSFFQTIFPNTPVTTIFEETVNDTDPDYINKMSFKTLRLSKFEVINKLINKGILPPNFYELKPEQLCN